MFGEAYPSKQGIPKAIPKAFASFIIHENSEPLFLWSERTIWKFCSSPGAYWVQGAFDQM